MDELFTFLIKLFDNSDWPPLWQGGKWNMFDGWFYILSDLFIASAFLILPVVIIIYVTRKQFSRFQNQYILASAFILLCGLAFLTDAIVFWYPVYRLAALFRFLAGLLSWITILSIIKVIPVVLKFRSARELSVQIKKHQTAEELLLIKNKQLNEAQEIARMGHWEWEVSSGNLSWSHGLYIVYGLDPDKVEISMTMFSELVHPDDRIFVNSIINNSYSEKKFPDYYHRIVLKSGEIKSIFARGEVILDNHGNVIKMIGTGQDVTKEKKIEEELIQKSRKLQIMNVELQKFAYITSHDLQEPLRKILTFGSRLQEELKDISNEKTSLYLEKISYSTARMQRLIDDVLKFSRFSGSNDFINVDLKLLLGQVITDLEVSIERKGAIIEIKEMPTIEANASQMGQLFVNMISNSLKFQPENNVPLIRISSEVMQGKLLPVHIHAKLTECYAGSMVNDINYLTYCCIYLSDNGIGFNQNYTDKIFEVFQRLNSNESYEGTGIGLAICKKIIENHQGVITATSIQGHGAQFAITLPVRQSSNENASAKIA